MRKDAGFLTVNAARGDSPSPRSFSRMLAAWTQTLRKAAARGQTLTGGLLAGNDGNAGLPEEFDALAKAQGDLLKADETLEKQFLAVGSSLESLSAVSKGFVRDSESLIGLATGRAGGDTAFTEALDLIEGALQYLERWQSETGASIAALQGFNAQIFKLLRVEDDLIRAMLPLKVVKTMYNVESACLPAEVRQKFMVLTEEIENLHGQVREIFGSKFHDLEATRETIAKVIEASELRLAELSASARLRRGQIQKTLEVLRRELSANRERDIRLTAMSRQIALQVDQVVMGLQYQDIIHQKLQHLSQAIEKIKEPFAAGAAGAKDKPALRFAQVACGVQVEQLKGIESDVAGAETAIRGGTGRILDQLSQVDSDCLSLQQFSALTTSVDGMVQVLMDSIGEVDDLVGETIVVASVICDSLRPVSQLASGLTGVVRKLAARIHLLGLNAQVQAARIEIGTGLEVLAARTSELSVETNGLSESAARQLDQLVAGLLDSVQRLQGLRNDGVAKQKFIADTGGAEKDRLHQFRDTALNLLLEVERSLQDIRAHGNEVIAHARPEAICRPALEALKEPMARIGALSGQLCGGSVAEMDAAEIESMRGSYSMASERRVFERAIAGPEAGQGSGTNEPPTERGVDLFEDFTAEAPRAEANKPISSATATAMTTTTTTATATPAAASAPAEALGANVELF